MSATRQSWTNLHRLPAKRSPLSLQQEFSEQELERIRLGFIPRSMEDRWFLFTEADTLYIHRSWTGYCMYQLRLVKVDTHYAIWEAFVNRDETQYAGSDNRYDEKLVTFLIDYLLLDKRSPLPIGVNLPLGIADELHHHHILGAGRRADGGTIHVTIPGMLKWLWQWLLWLIKR